MSSTSKQNRGDGCKRAKRSRSLLPEEEADQRGNTGGGEDTLKKDSEADQRVNVDGGEVTLKKGPWTKKEDEILVDHIKKHGEGNWNAVQKESGLARCGKSCRLRWFNHLRPGLKKGSFTAEEERLIFEYHFLKGSKWAHMAALLPGRTDNEIKNFWYTRSKKRQRAGLPIYPNEITSKYSFNGSQESADILANESSQSDETENFNMDITDLDLKDYKFCPDMLPPFFDSQDAWIRHRYLISSSSASVPEVFDQYGQYPMLSTPFDPILDTNLLHGYDNPIPGFHAASNISSSEPIYGSMSFELPSFQSSPTQQCTWSGMYVSPLPSFESVDTPVQAPPIESCLSVPVPVPDSPDWSHLIDPIVYYNSDQNLEGTSIDSLQANTESMAPNEADISTQWNGLDYDQCPALSTRQINISRWFHSEIETSLDDIYGDAFNDQLPADSSFDKEDNLNQKGLALPNAVLDSG